MSEYLQVIDVVTDNYDELARIQEDYEKSDNGRSGVRSVRISRDRDFAGPGERYLVAVLFSSYEDAQRNNLRTETQEFAQRATELSHSVGYMNLDVVHTWEANGE